MDERINQALVSLQHSPFRSGFKLSRQDLPFINKKSVEIIRSHAFDFVTSRVAPRYPKNDGKQTPMKNHPVFIAQHATATCCRNCIQKWYGIKKGNALTDPEIHFIINLIMQWIEQQMDSRLQSAAVH